MNSPVFEERLGRHTKRYSRKLKVWKLRSRYLFSIVTAPIDCMLDSGGHVTLQLTGEQAQRENPVELIVISHLVLRPFQLTE